YAGLIHDIEIGTKILLDDGLIELKVLAIDHTEQEIKTEALNSGVIKDHKGVNIPNVRVNLPGITKKDTQDIIFGIKQVIDFIAASFVRRATDLLEIRAILEDYDATHIQVISKIENKSVVDNLEQLSAA